MCSITEKTEKIGGPRARPLRRAIQSLIEDRLADSLLSGQFASGMQVSVDVEGDELAFAESAG